MRGVFSALALKLVILLGLLLEVDTVCERVATTCACFFLFTGSYSPRLLKSGVSSWSAELRNML